MTSFRFVHTADIHLDSPLRGLAGHHGRATERIQRATREAFDDLISQTIREEASFLVIAGDLYDGDWRDYQTGLFFISQMGRLARAGIPVFLAYGNHDAESQITKSLVLPDNVKVFPSRKPVEFGIEELGVVLHGQSYKKRDLSENLALQYPEPISGMFNIGVLHTGLGGIGGHENYAPCSLNELVSKGYDYWALGHVHQGNILHERPYVVFPGNLQGRQIRETGEKHACLVSVDESEVAEIEQLSCDTVRWALLKVDMNDCQNVSEASIRIRNEIELAVSNEESDRLLACRLLLEGKTECHGALLSSTEHLLAEARAAALSLGDEAAWVEKVVIDTRPDLDPTTRIAREDAMGDLQRMISFANEEDSFLIQIKAELGEFINKLPHEIRKEAEDRFLRSAIDGDTVNLLNYVSEYITGQIIKGER